MSRLRTDAFLEQFLDEAHAVLALLEREQTNLAVAPSSAATRCGAALRALSGSCSFVGLVELGQESARTAQAFEQAAANATPDVEHLAALVRVIRRSLESQIRCLSGGATRDKRAAKLGKDALAPLVFSAEQEVELVRLLRLTFRDSATFVGHREMLYWPAFIDSVLRVDFGELWSGEERGWFDSAGVRVDRAQARSLAAWLCRLAQSVRRGAGASGVCTMRGHMVPGVATWIARVEITNLPKDLPLAVDPAGLEMWGARVSVRQAPDHRTFVELVVPWALPIAVVDLFRANDKVYAVSPGLAVSPDIGGNSSEEEATAAGSVTMKDGRSLPVVADPCTPAPMVQMDEPIGRSVGLVYPAGRYLERVRTVRGVLRYRDQAVPLLVPQCLGDRRDGKRGQTR